MDPEWLDGMFRHPNQRCTVAVLDGGSPPAMSVIRSLGARGVHVTVLDASPRVAGRYSCYAAAYQPSPPLEATDEMVDWLASRLAAGTIGAVVPTSDQSVFVNAVAHREANLDASPGTLDVAAAWRALHKGEFGRACASAGVPTLPYALPVNVDDAVASATELGYPVVLKPRSHVGVGLHRGVVVDTEAELRAHFRPLGIERGSVHASELDRDLEWPMVQRFVEPQHGEVLSITGCFDEDGGLMVVDACRKLRQWPPTLGVGSLFEVVDHDPLIETGVEVARAVLGRGLFEIEFVVDSRTGESWPIDLNPRGYGQMELAVSRGNDLPGCWFELETGISLRPLPVAEKVPEVWQARLTLYPGLIADALRSLSSRHSIDDSFAALRRPSIDAMYRRDDLVPAVVLGAQMLRRPGNLIRPFIRPAR